MQPNLTLPGSGEASETDPAALARLPSIDRLLTAAPLQALIREYGQTWVKRAAQQELAAQRESIRSGAVVPQPEALNAALYRAIAARVGALDSPRLRPVINLSGTVIHTNLGRALLADEAIAALAESQSGYCALEFDLDGGGRGDRDDVVEGLLRELTGAEAATVVNNNAAAVLLGLTALAAKKEVLISRGELIEIGGAFRMPDIMKAAGCRLVEVGTTNRTHARDFEAAIGSRTALLVKAHWSNYAITGFTAAVDDSTLAKLAHEHGCTYMVDLGAGALLDLSAFGLPREPLPQDSLRAGADVVTFSGDKLLGGPQAGIVVGTRAAIGRLKKHPLKRALRVSKLTLAALEATLRIYDSGHRLAERLPVLALLTRPPEQIRASALRLAPALQTFAGNRFSVEVAACASQIGSGSLPVDRLPSFAVRAANLSPGKRSGRAVEQLAAELRALPRPVIGRIHEQALWLDCRTLRADDEAPLLDQLQAHAARPR